MMRDLTAQLSSSLLRFPEVTVDALSEDEVTLDSVLHGKFTVGGSGLAWLACGSQLEVVHAVTGERFSAYNFSGVSDQAPAVQTVREFSWLKRSGLLLGLQEDQASMLCLYDLAISRVVKAVVMPGRITAIEPLVSYGGASTSTQHLHQSLRWFFGVVAVVTDVGHVLLVDLCLDDLSCTQTELEASDLEVVNKSPSEIPRLREGVTQQGRHLCLQLCSPTGTGASALTYIQHTNQLAVGFTDGYLQLWNMKTLKKEYHSQLEGGRVPVYAFTFQEPENDPRNCCYLWAVQSAQDLEGDVVSLRLLQLAFGERKCLSSGKILYEGLEYCEERYSQDLSGTAFPLRAQATNTRLLSCQTIEKFRHHPDRDDSMSEVVSPDTSVSIFSWQVKSYGQGQPSTFIGVFDINRWYHAQMPDSLRTGESLRSCPYLAVWCVDVLSDVCAGSSLLDVLIHERSLSRGLPHTCPPPEQFYNPTTYNFNATCLLSTGIVHLTCSGHQKETLGFLKKSVASLSDGISSGYSLCLMSGLLSPRLSDVQPSSLSQEEQLDALLNTAVETSSLGLITGCIKEWTAQEHPGSAEKLRYILEWAWDKVVHTKEELDNICAPLFDSSSNFTDPQLLHLLQHSQRLLTNLSTIFTCLLQQAQELTQRGLIGLMNKSMVSSLISQYSQVVLWFCRTGLLPEISDDDVLQMSRPFYSFSVIKNYYTGQRDELQRLAKDKWCADCLMIDGLVAQCGERLAELWKRDEGGTGQYPPPTLHALLDVYLLENVEESAKHAIVIYLLLDVMYSFPNKSGACVESFPTAFSIPIGLVKLVQGLWLLDHHDHESSLELLLHPATSQCVWWWQHTRVLQALMCQKKPSIALRYLHVMKPSISTNNQTKLCLSVLLHNRCIVEAWSLLRQQVNSLNVEELLMFLFETCEELNLMKELLKLPLSPLEQECLERYLQETGGFQNRELLMIHFLQQANYVPALQINQTLKLNLAADRDPKMKERSNTRNSILHHYAKVLPRAQRRLATERTKPYQQPTTLLTHVSRPQPLSALVKRCSTETVLSRASFIKNVLTKIQEVWLSKDGTPEPSPHNSPRETEMRVLSPNPPSHLPEAFVGTPINMLSKRMSRLFDLVVQPSSHTSPEAPHTQGTPPRPTTPWTTTPRPTTPWTTTKTSSKAPELSLLQTPQVVKRARALATSAPVFSSFTPQSILRSSLRPTPVATPSASPARSLTPPLRPKESRITFLEHTASPELPKSSVTWSNGLPAEITESKRPLPPPEGGVEVWSEHSGEEEEDVRESSVEKKKMETPVKESLSVLPCPLRRPSLGHETSQLSLQSDTTTTLEFQDALLPAALGGQILEHTPTCVETSLDEEVVLRLPATTQQVDQIIITEAPELTPDTETQLETNRTSLNDEEENLSTQDSPVTPETRVPELQQEKTSSADVSEELNHLPDVAEESNQPVLPNQVTHTPQEALEPSEVLSRESSSAPDSITEAFAFDTEPVPDLQEPEEESGVQATVSCEELLHHQLREDDVQNIRPEAEEAAENMETSDLDEYVERHLFGDDLSPALTCSGLKDQSDTWMSFNSDPVCEVKSVDVEADAVDAPADAQKSVASSEAATSESHSVVSLNDTDELSSAQSEEEVEEEEEEDSGSEVEIIEEVKGRQLPPSPPVYLQQLPSHHQLLQEHTTAVLSLVSPDTQLKVLDGEMEEDEGGEGEGEVVMVGLEAADLDDEGVCYTELKPSTTLLVPLQLTTEHQQLLEGGAFQALAEEEVEEEEAPPGGGGAFSLTLEAGDEEEPEVDPSNHLVLHQEAEELEDMETQPDDVLLEASDEHVEKMINDVQSVEPVLGTRDAEEQPDQSVIEEELREEDNLDLKERCENVDAEGDAGDDAGDAEDADDVESPSADVQKDEPARVEKAMEESSLVRTKEVDVNMEVLPLPEKEKSSQEASNAMNEPTMDKEEKKFEAPKEEETSVKEAPRSPGRRGRKTVTFPLPVLQSEEEQMLPSTLRRVTRSGRQLRDPQLPVTPRRSVRKAEPEVINESEVLEVKPSKPSTPSRTPRKVEPEVINEPKIKPSKPASPGRTPQKATPRKGTRRTRNTNVESVEEEAQPMEEAAPDDAVVPQVRPSARKSRKASLDVPEAPKVPEVPQAPEVPGVSEAPQAPEAPEEFPEVPASPGRVTRKSTRGLSLALESFQKETSAQVTPPRNRRRTIAGSVEKASDTTLVMEEAQLQKVSRRLTRSRLWSHEEKPEKKEEEPEKKEVESDHPLAEALMERLREEEVVTEIVRAKRRSSRPAASSSSSSSSHLQDSGVTAAAETTKKPNAQPARRTRASKLPPPELSPVQDSFTFTSSLQPTRGKKKESVKTDINTSEMLLSPPVTRTRRAASAEEHPEEKQSDDVAVEEIKPRKKRSTRTKAEPVLVKVELVSPPAGQSLSQSEQNQEPLRINLRRRRMMEAIFPKPVTRRRKL